MRTYNLSPLFRTTVGFDRMGDIFDTVFQPQQDTVSYPPYNIVKLGEDQYRITMAVAGFAENDLDVTIRDNQLVVTGKLVDENKETTVYLHRGIAAREFERKFNLADYVKVVDAALSDGLLRIELAREVPEAMKPRRIAIQSAPGSTAKVIEGQKAA